MEERKGSGMDDKGDMKGLRKEPGIGIGEKTPSLRVKRRQLKRTKNTK